MGIQLGPLLETRKISLEELNPAIKMIENTECIVEEFQEFDSEVSIIASRGESGSVLTYDSGTNLHKNGILINYITSI